MATAVLKLGPVDDGRRITWEQFRHADCRPGRRYDVIDGRLRVWRAQELSENLLETWVRHKLDDYQDRYPRRIGFIATKARVHVTKRSADTVIQPDLTVYKTFPMARRWTTLTWADLSPVFAVGIVRPRDRLDADRQFLCEVPSVREYWVIDPSEGYERPKLHQSIAIRPGGWATHTVYLPQNHDDPLEVRSIALRGFAITLDIRR
jgi:Uma2 family endonuclease